MNRYTVRSTFHDPKGRFLFARKTFEGGAEDAKAALIEAHKEMARLGAEDQRVDSISSIVKGPNEEISTTDYLDELESNISGHGLLNEVTPQQLERGTTGGIANPAKGGFATGGMIGNPTKEGDGLYGGGIGANRAKGGVVQSHDTFRDGDGRDTAKVHGGDIEGPDAQDDPASDSGGRRGWNDPSANPLADIQAGRRRIEEDAYGVPAWITPEMIAAYPDLAERAQELKDHRSPNADTTPGEYDVSAEEFLADHVFPNIENKPKTFRDHIEIKIGTDKRKIAPFVKSRKTVGDIIKESRAAGQPTLEDMRKLVKASRLGIPRGPRDDRRGKAREDRSLRATTTRPLGR